LLPCAAQRLTQQLLDEPFLSVFRKSQDDSFESENLREAPKLLPPLAMHQCFVDYSETSSDIAVACDAGCEDAHELRASANSPANDGDFAMLSLAARISVFGSQGDFHASCIAS